MLLFLQKLTRSRRLPCMPPPVASGLPEKGQGPCVHDPAPYPPESPHCSFVLLVRTKPLFLLLFQKSVRVHGGRVPSTRSRTRPSVPESHNLRFAKAKLSVLSEKPQNKQGQTLVDLPTRSSAQGNCSAKSLAGNVIDSSLSSLSSTSLAGQGVWVQGEGGWGGG